MFVNIVNIYILYIHNTYYIYMYKNMGLIVMDMERQFEVEVTHVNLVLNPSGVASPGGQPLTLERRPSRCLVVVMVRLFWDHQIQGCFDICIYPLGNSHIPPLEEERHLQKCLGSEYMSSQEDICIIMDHGYVRSCKNFYTDIVLHRLASRFPVK